MTQSACSTCNGECCTKYAIMVTAFDVLRLRDGLNLNPIHFVSNYSAEEVESEYPIFRLGSDWCRLGMDTKIGSEGCIFLMNIHGVKRCSAYAHRPTNCRTYPIKINGRDNLEFIKQNKCPKIEQPSLEVENQYASDAQTFKKELTLYSGIVAQWNEEHAQNNFQQFLDFILQEATI